MQIVTTRRISQIFFLGLFLWFCVASTLGDAWWQLRGWPVNLFLQLDPLVGLGTLLTTHTIYAELLWGLVTVVLTILLGRFFCGWLCPFGTLHQLIGFLARRKKSAKRKAGLNRYHQGHAVKYWILIFMLTAAIADLAAYLVRLPRNEPWVFGWSVIIALSVLVVLTMMKLATRSRRVFIGFFSVLAGWLALSYIYRGDRLLAASLQTGLLDPIPLFQRSVNLVLLPLFDGTVVTLSSSLRYYDGAWLLGAIFFAAVLLNFVKPRFYCRFVCPLGALFAVLGRFALWRIGKGQENCPLTCHLCETNCEGGCSPSGQIRVNECVLCCNCLTDCFEGRMGYRTVVSASGETVTPDVSRRAFMASVLSGAAAIPVIRLNGHLGANWQPGLIRPPGAMEEAAFLSRCIKCGQCMRVCPTNVIHPALFQGGLEGLWTPVLNFRVGTSGCQMNCIACGNICPTAAIRPITLDERLGRSRYDARGPIKTGTAFVDRGRCLPWAMDRPCIVCQENCPVSPKAINTRVSFNSVEALKGLRVKSVKDRQIEVDGGSFEPGRYSSGDYFFSILEQGSRQPVAIVKNTDTSLFTTSFSSWKTPPVPGNRLQILVRLQQPYVDPKRCIGCGVCEHECPVRGKRAIRVTADNETRTKDHALILNQN